MIGPNVKRLTIRKMPRDAVPDGGVIVEALGFLSSPDRLSQVARDAAAWVDGAILAVRQAANPNPWRDKSDEDIAGEILRQIEEKR